jgi:hypothetical protein
VAPLHLRRGPIVAPCGETLIARLRRCRYKWLCDSLPICLLSAANMKLLTQLLLAGQLISTTAQQWPVHSDGLNDVVQWDHYSLIVNGQRLFFWSGEFHYWRIPVPELWRDILEKVKAGELLYKVCIAGTANNIIQLASMPSPSTAIGASTALLPVSWISRPEHTTSPASLNSPRSSASMYFFVLGLISTQRQLLAASQAGYSRAAMAPCVTTTPGIPKHGHHTGLHCRSLRLSTRSRVVAMFFYTRSRMSMVSNGLMSVLERQMRQRLPI